MKVRRIAAAAGAIALTMLLMAGCPKEEGGVGTQPGHDPNPDKRKATAAASPGEQCKPMVDPAVPPNLDKKRYVTIFTCVEDAFGPYTVTYHAANGLTGETLASTEEQVVGHEPFNRIIGYDTGQKVTITIEVRPARAGSRNGYIIARDGKGNTKSTVIDGAWTAKVLINVAR